MIPAWPPVMLLSMWRNDAAQRLIPRAEHLLYKSYPALRWVWVVGDSNDATTRMLHRIAEPHRAERDIMILDIGDSRLDGTTPAGRLERFSRAASAGLGLVGATERYVVIHESDIVSPPDVIERLVTLADAGDVPRVVGGWPVLPLDGGLLFYDVWAYRADGRHFTNWPPYHPCYRPETPFPVDSVGTVYALPAASIRAGVRCPRGGAVELCRQMRERGHEVWVDPTLWVQQPPEHFTPRAFPPEVA